MDANHQEPEEWISLFSCVARMGELHQNYRSYLGWARGDLEATICAGRAALRGRRHGLADSSLEVISEPITARHRLDPIHNTLSERKPGPLGYDVLFRDVEVEWSKIKGHLQRIATKRWLSDGEVVEPAKPNSNARPVSWREFTKEYIEREKSAGRTPTISELEKIAQTAGYRGGRRHLRKAFHALQNTAGIPVRRGRIKKSPG
jgi:hypothetical protein